MRPLITIIIFYIVIQAIAQTDNVFWFVAPDLTAGHNNIACSPGGGRPAYLRLSSVNNAVSVTISQPANPAFTPINVNIAAGQTQSVLLDAFLASIENYPDNTINNKGILIQSFGGDITAYYEVANCRNADIWALKGRNALGREFVVPGQNLWENGWPTYDPDPYNEVHIVATEDNTVIEIIPSKAARGGYPAGVPFTITLMHGQTFNLRAEGQLGADNLCGTRIRVLAGGEIAITISDDSVKKLDPGTCYDVNGDQLIPVSFVGHEYLVMKGKVASDEHYFVTALQNNTQVIIDGVLTATLNAYQTQGFLINKNFVHVKTSVPSYVYHITGFGCEMGGAVLPTIELCTGSNSVSFVRSSSESFYMNLMVRDGGQNGFRIYYEDGSFFSIPGTWFEQDPISKWWILKDANKLFANSMAGGVPVNQVTKVTNQERFHLGIYNGGETTTCNYGYFSDYTPNRGQGSVYDPSSGTFTSLITACFGDSVRLYATGGRSYSWYPSLYLNDPYIANPVVRPPSGIFEYTVTIGRETCFPDTNIKITVEIAPEIEANFTYDTPEGCAPFTLKIHNNSFGVTDQCRWDFDGDGTWDSNTNAPIFSPPPYQNTTRKDTIYNLRLVVLNLQGCVDELIRPVRVLPEINAAFTVSSDKGCHPLTVNFTNNSGGDTSRFYWSFGDNASSIVRHPIHAYINYGTTDSIYTATLIAESPYMCRDTADTTITVYSYINVNFSVDTVNLCAPQSIILRNKSVGVQTYYLSFGDGTPDIIVNALKDTLHTYTNTTLMPVMRTIRMIGVNASGCRDTMIRTVRVNPQVTAAFTKSHINVCDSTLVLFDGVSSGGPDLKFYWNFGDGGSFSFPLVYHRYMNKSSAPVKYAVSLIVESSQFCRDTLTDTIQVFPYIGAFFAVDTVWGCTPLQVKITNTSVGVDTYTWNFGDASPLSHRTDTVFSYIYSNASFTVPQTYVLTLGVENSYGCKDSISRNITVEPRITSSFTIDKTESCFPAVFNLQSTSQGAAYLLWDMGDGASSSQPTFAYEYSRNLSASPVVYTIQLTAIASNNMCKHTCDTVVTVNPFIRAEYVHDKDIDCPPFLASFVNVSVGSNNSYEWSVNSVVDPTAPTNTLPFSKLFYNNTSSIMSYVVRLDAQNAEGCTDWYQDTIYVYPKVVADFVLNDSVGCHPYNAVMTNTSQNASYYLWTFGDQSSSSQVHVSHRYHNYYQRDTSYQIRLVASSGHCFDTTYKTVHVYAKPVASFEVSNTAACSPLIVTMQNYSLYNTSQSISYAWQFGDGNNSSDESPTHTYINQSGVSAAYNVQLIATSRGMCRDTMERKVTVFSEVEAAFMPSIAAGCSPLMVIFSNNSSNNVSQYIWNFGDGTPPSGVTIPQHNFINNTTTTQTYEVVLKVQSIYGCSDADTASITVYPSPETEFSVTPTHQYYPNTTVNLSNLTTPGPWSFEWNFADGNTSTVQQPGTYSYQTWGTYRIKLRAYSPTCYDTVSHVIIIYPPKPIASYIKTSDGCVPLEVTFTNTSQYASSYLWEFDDGSTSTEASPTHTFTTANIYRVKLTAFGDGGKDYAYQSVEAYRLPEIKFTVTPDTVMVPGDKIVCYNETDYAVRYLWSFGDGNFSMEKSPYYEYGTTLVNTFFMIKLTAWSDHDCEVSDSLLNGVYVSGRGKLKYPNFFTPSKSGPSGGDVRALDINDNTVFRPLTEGVLVYSLKIYNRWGELVFHTNDINQGWDGYYKGRLAKQGVYVYIAEGKYSNGQPFVLRGDVTLLIE